ncbi:MAG: hypothetical protein M3442_18035 [Chloroflexota bacterium]|nr:hypothetical protein [Chloroflexota bacterium]
MAQGQDIGQPVVYLGQLPLVTGGVVARTRLAIEALRVVVAAPPVLDVAQILLDHPCGVPVAGGEQRVSRPQAGLHGGVVAPQHGQGMEAVYLHCGHDMIKAERREAGHRLIQEGQRHLHLAV